jgi:hypothetical protein
MARSRFLVCIKRRLRMEGGMTFLTDKPFNFGEFLNGGVNRRWLFVAGWNES